MARHYPMSEIIEIVKWYDELTKREIALREIQKMSAKQRSVCVSVAETQIGAKEALGLARRCITRDFELSQAEIQWLKRIKDARK